MTRRGQESDPECSNQKTKSPENKVSFSYDDQKDTEIKRISTLNKGMWYIISIISYSLHACTRVCVWGVCIMA